MKRVLILAAALAPLLLAGCSTPCEDLAEQICGCEPTRSAREACQRRATQRQDARPPTDAQQDRCEALLDTCDCHMLQTAEGKRACGLAE